MFIDRAVEPAGTALEEFARFIRDERKLAERIVKDFRHAARMSFHIASPQFRSAPQAHEASRDVRSSHQPPQLAELVQGRLHPLDRGGIRLRTAAPAQRVAHLLKGSFAAHYPVQDM